MSFPRYEKYKSSGVEWLGAVPEHWDVRRLGYFFRERREKVSDKDYEPLSVTKNGILPQLETAAKTDDGDNRKKVSAGDFVINSRSDRKGSSGLAERDGSVSLINTVLLPIGDITGTFAHHLFRCVLFQEEYYRYGKGIVADLWSTNYSEMRNISLAVPPRSEQSCIATFLDRETAKIDALVAKQQRLIELLKEKRQAVISHAVTKGLNADAPMKDSGVEWLGQIPAHWEVKPLKYTISKIEQGWSPQCESHEAENEEWGVLKIGCVNGHCFNEREHKALPLDLEPVTEYQVCHGDILMSRGNTLNLVGMAAYVKRIRPKLLLSDLLYRFRALTEYADGEFLVLQLRSTNLRFQLEQSATGTSHTMKKVGQNIIRNLVIPLPPIEEQRKIVSDIEKQVGKIDLLDAQAQHAVDLLQERRTALISAAVTGKIDVRNAVANEKELVRA